LVNIIFLLLGLSFPFISSFIYSPPPKTLFFLSDLLLICFLTTLEPIFLGGTPIYPSNLPKALPPTNPLTSIILPTLPLHSPPSPMLQKHEQHGHLGLGLEELEELEEHEKWTSFKSSNKRQLEEQEEAGAYKT
jgi:hypothetical protein